MPDGFIRPEPVYLSESATVPENNYVRPAPNVFSHSVTGATPFFYDDRAGAADGQLAADTLVLLLRHEDDWCCVVDGRGLYVWVMRTNLRALTQ
jgi:hypothetical protein